MAEDIQEIKDLQAAQKEQLEAIDQEVKEIEEILANPPGGASPAIKAAIKEITSQVRAHTGRIKGFVTPSNQPKLKGENVVLKIRVVGEEPGVSLKLEAEDTSPKGEVSGLWGGILDAYIQGVKNSEPPVQQHPVSYSACLLVDGQEIAGESVENSDLTPSVRGQIAAVKKLLVILEAQLAELLIPPTPEA